MLINFQTCQVNVNNVNQLLQSCFAILIIWVLHTGTFQHDCYIMLTCTTHKNSTYVDVRSPVSPSSVWPCSLVRRSTPASAFPDGSRLGSFVVTTSTAAGPSPGGLNIQHDKHTLLYLHTGKTCKT